MLNPLGKYKINVREEKNNEYIKYGYKLNENLFITEEKYDIILFDFKLKKKILSIKFHNHLITSLHICKKVLYIDKKESTFSNNSFFILSSSLDKKFALHNIYYNNLSFNYKLIAEHKPTRDEINGIIQIENGQILVATRDQSLLLFSNKITDGNFEMLFEIKKAWPMQVSDPFEIKNNLIGVCWEYDDAEADETYDDDTYELNHSNDGLFFYLIDNNEIKGKKIFKNISIFPEKYFFILLENKFILSYYNKGTKELGVFDSNNLEFIFKIRLDFSSYIYPFNKKHFILFYLKDNIAKINIYNINTMKMIQNYEIETKETKPVLFHEYHLFPINTDEYAFKNLIFKIY